MLDSSGRVVRLGKQADHRHHLAVGANTEGVDRQLTHPKRSNLDDPLLGPLNVSVQLVPGAYADGDADYDRSRGKEEGSLGCLCYFVHDLRIGGRTG